MRRVPSTSDRQQRDERNTRYLSTPRLEPWRYSPTNQSQTYDPPSLPTEMSRDSSSWENFLNISPSLRDVQSPASTFAEPLFSPYSALPDLSTSDHISDNRNDRRNIFIVEGRNEAPNSGLSINPMQLLYPKTGDTTSTTASNQNPEIVCFGTIPGISAKCNRPGPREITWPLQVQMEFSPSDQKASSDTLKQRCFTAVDFPEIRGRILSSYGQMMQGLLEVESLSFHASCMVSGEPTGQQLPCTLELTIYGPLDFSDELGSWLGEYDVFLQDPQLCHKDVRYCNPHKLSSEVEVYPLLREVVAQTSSRMHLQAIIEGPNLLDSLDSGKDLEESPQPPAIFTALKRHQKQALTFMLSREQEREFHGKQQSIWETVDTDYQQHFVNRVSDMDQLEVPRQFYGGIIADPMGFGKTLTMIALAATDQILQSSPEYMDIEENRNPSVATTLIIVPPTLLDTWEEQLSEHVYAGQLKFRRHHGKTRLSSPKDATAYNIILTTYHTVAIDLRTGNTRNQSPLFSIFWRRIILDEAHVIRNANSQLAKAVCSLDAQYRWAVTGTPIQNHLSDLAALLKFIRVYPYDDIKRFEADISNIWKSGEDEEAVKRLQRLATCLLLRRPKRTISLPSREDLRCPVEFTRPERDEYNKMLQQTRTRIDEALDQDSEVERSRVYINILQQIKSLRIFCNMGLLYNSRHEQQALKPSDDWNSIAQNIFNLQQEMGPIDCFSCPTTVDVTDTLPDEPKPKHSPLFTRCFKFSCSECSYKLKQADRVLICGHNPPCPSAPISLDQSAKNSTLEDVTSLTPALPANLPSKVAALIDNIRTLPRDVKCVVFSSWRLTLNIVAAGLEQAGITAIRFDGKVPQRDRQAAVDRFRNDADARVMLLTLSCGAVGLTLTVASRAYLVEPHWNPSLEEQALARIHRLGQTREVTTIRFYMRNSFEEQVMKVQEKKKQLAGVLLSRHDEGKTDESLDNLQKLRSLL
ncbi:hypothetical protein CDD82_7766 [Ophiocordyceps australis]|uniref:Helicase ATP-binding domain-containing protein n=1 Tax=Ophiocordyceps australis TaxID=1399860 RepID=A0A2C5ZPT0_9HYPO|nr:hypothetical protein CDD82_7766 [Ophiocordyceps australis]